MNNKIIVLVGPTAIGKTELSIEIAKQYNMEVISGDSMQIYKGMDIGTGKITVNEMDGVTHHLIDVITPEEIYSVAEFQKTVKSLIQDSYERGKTPFIVGGTGFYIQALLYEFKFDKDHETDTKIKYDALVIGLNRDRAKLYEIINARVDDMFEAGLEEEVRELYGKYAFSYTANGAIGYKEFLPYFDGEITIDEVKKNIQKNSRNYAKRQLTYFRNKLPVTWFDKDKDSKEDVFEVINAFLEKNI
ncbi:tRNA (adenosine(37)-N6)-dimethylallyltransferase [Phocicoccus pinnipedialis]|uniref:tRNA dimethylallyltransferase n=1 Tax=Phocicoccus pinnipedialis TaxID=110845 RepID=A0A6V7RF89_9BACL|nr:tRNA (adenosine(37)-N6)-dimethylallyltransferase MiaA [Jeotgalicoccus pinnipedialis]MBP1939147.1 tRNA dimethylallyltransferase [Jeotgalicoccus pinnipedialis]CAD2076587.1 tRNA dimethylallyltransferase [Jeotgalicoccus pinnipedialis]